jgi:hypothetical protein
LIIKSTLARVGIRLFLSVLATIIGAVVYHLVRRGSFQLTLQVGFYIAAALLLAGALYSFTGGASMVGDRISRGYQVPRPGDNETAAEFAAVAVVLLTVGLIVRSV